MNADKNGIQMSNAVHQYALFGNALFKLNKTVVHASDPRKQIVICSNGPDIRYATLEEWDKAGKSFNEHAQTEGIVTSASPARDKLELFRNLFSGRKDVHAHGYRRKDGGIGYTPACANEWRPGICPKANHQRIKCAECRSRTFLELNDAAIIAHFKGSDDRLRDVIGQYVLDKDCNTNVLVIDFDKADWKEAANAIRLVAKKHGIDAAIERSRSGNGAHIWFFFLESVSAKTARDFGSCLIIEAAALNKSITFETFDRMLPAQSTIPEGGFGNLIALPFQGKAQRKGNSVFVDERFEPFPDQWLYLSQIQLISRATVESDRGHRKQTAWNSNSCSDKQNQAQCPKATKAAPAHATRLPLEPARHTSRYALHPRKVSEPGSSNGSPQACDICQPGVLPCAIYASISIRQTATHRPQRT